MGDLFLPRLVNGPFDDPALYVTLRHSRRALLFDLERIDTLTTREVLKISDVFVSHTHVDHFIGFDHLLRCSLNKPQPIHLYGPRGIIENVRGKLAGYTWNLIQDYPLQITVHEVIENLQRTVQLEAAKRFEPVGEETSGFDGTLLREPTFTVSGAILDHRIPCLAFSLQEAKRLNVKPDQLEALGLQSGPWLDALKRTIREGAPGATPLEIPRENGGRTSLSLDEWRRALILEDQGQKIAYVVDCLFSPANTERILLLAREADLFYCEASFAEADAERASDRYHLTATQAGSLARLARARHFIPFHFSHRYEREPRRLLDEAMKRFANP